MVKKYLNIISGIAQQEDAREESYYTALEGLIYDYAQSTKRLHTHVTILPKPTEAGNPDFRVWDGKLHITGYIEAKPPTTEYLDQIEVSEQVKRYRKTFPNLILTNFFEFRLYRNGDLITKTQIARPALLYKLKMTPPEEKISEFYDLVEKFFSFSLPKITSAETLALELAKRTRFLRDEVISLELQEDEKFRKDSILGFYEAFRQYLIAGLTKEDFADLYSQTVTYGLFAARSRSQNGFNRKLAYDHIPPTIGILREVFHYISLGKLSKQMEWIVDDIADVLEATDVGSILQHQYKMFNGVRPPDPIIHFYETFLAKYDPYTRARRGVYYTPEPVVSYIVRSLNIILKERFSRADGFASPTVTVLDPAAGTLTFLAEAAREAVDEFTSKYGKGGRENFIKEHVLKNFYAFELMMAPYAVGHLKMSFLLTELGYELKEDDRIKLYLTNTLEMEELAQTELPGMASLSEESHLAGEIKRQRPILVVLGNPPYSVSSANKSLFIEKEMELYKRDVRNERNIQPLSDDYIKFIRFAHWKIESAGQGVIGMITNNSYLSGLIHRGMRKALLESFDEIYILNLHGNSRIGEKCPDGSKDENVFDIQQGVAIAIFVRHKGPKRLGKIYYQEVFGLRERKYEYLFSNDLKFTKWKKLELSTPYYFFVEKDFSLSKNYQRFNNLKEIFKEFSFGVTTSRDHFVVGFTKTEISQRLNIFTGNLPDQLVKEGLSLDDTPTWDLSESRQAIKGRKLNDEIIQYSYRPFDNRWICYDSALIERDRRDIMQHIVKKNNLGLTLTRRLRDPIWQHLYCTQYVTDKTLLSSRDNGYFFPLYIYSQKKRSGGSKRGTILLLLEPQADYGIKEPNLHTNLVENLSKVYSHKPSPEQIFFYIYAILHSNLYRIRYAEFLRIDFPRIPFTQNEKLFINLVELGKQLVDLHLMTSRELNPSIAKYQGKGDNSIEKPRYDEESGRVYINQSQYFEGIEKKVWLYQIGGYQVCEKWLKDRKGRSLNLEDIQHYCKIVAALSNTIEIQTELDKLYPEVEKSLIELNQ